MPLDKKKLSTSAYQPNDEVKKLFAQVQTDYQVSWRLQHRSFDEFDGVSLLQRAKIDQETFGVFVGAQWVPQQKRWRWKGRKNTARNKLIGLLAHMLAAMLYPVVHAQNEEDEPDKMTARVMRILVEEHLRKAGYKMKFLYMVLSALVNPAVLVNVDYVIAYQRIKEQLASGVKITEVIDNFLSGISMRIIPIDQLLLADFFVNDIQKQPYVIEVDRISYDQARKIYGGHKDFKYVEAGKTRIMLAGQEHLTLYDIEWTEADRTAVQVIKILYRDEDLETIWVGGVFMGNDVDVYNTNPFKHRRMSLIGDEWKSIPIYPYAKGGFEPIDPTGRFAYYKSGAFKEYWDDATQNKMHQLLIDGTYLDVIKPLFISGVAKVDSNVIAPGAGIGMPMGSNVTPFSMGPNLVGAMNAMNKQEQDMSESTQDKLMNGVSSPDITATQSIQAQNQARTMMGVFAAMTADLITQVGELTMDCIIQHTTVGEIDATIPEALQMKYKTILSKGKSKGKDITNRIVFTDSFMGKTFTKEEINQKEWALWEKAGGIKSDQVIYEVNPYLFARTQFSLFIDPDEITNHAMGNDRMHKLAGFQMFTNPAVAPFVDMKNVIDDFVIEPFADGDPERYQAKAQPQQGNVNDMMKGVMGGQPSQPPQPVPSPLGSKGGVGTALQNSMM